MGVTFTGLRFHMFLWLYVFIQKCNFLYVEDLPDSVCSCFTVLYHKHVINVVGLNIKVKYCQVLIPCMWYIRTTFDTIGDLHGNWSFYFTCFILGISKNRKYSLETLRGCLYMFPGSSIICRHSLL